MTHPARRTVPLADYAAIGDGRTVALVARDGAIDWLPLPNLDSPTVFAACLDPERGGHLALQPEIPFTSQRRYLPDTNVLETMFHTSHGVVRVTDALTLSNGGLQPQRELVRRVEGLTGSVPMRWQVAPRFGYGMASSRLRLRDDVPVALSGGDALAVLSYDAGAPALSSGDITGRVEVAAGQRALLVLAAAHGEPLVLPARADADARLDATAAAWRGWVGRRRHGGPWKDAVVRSALLLKLLVHAPSGAIAAAATTSLPEQVGGERNWDYRYSWVRDSVFTLDALQRLGCAPEATSYFWWLMHASQLTHPHLRVLYRLDGGTRATERTLPLAGYRGSRPVRIGNAAAGQLQLDTYGELLQTAWSYARAGNALDRDLARRLARLADHVARTWRAPDAGIWEVRSQPRHFTQSKMMCWVALDRAADLAATGHLPGRTAHRWRRQAGEIRRSVERDGYSPRLGAYVRAAGDEELDASLLLGVIHRYGGPDDRLAGTVDAVRRRLGTGPFVYRYTGEDGLAGHEGAFVACSFWLAEALARTGRREAAGTLMDELVGLANDVGMYSEEIDPSSGEFLGNLPQALSHLALINAAHTIGSGGAT